MTAVPDGIVVGDDGRARCWWACGDPLYRPYHDDEWGHPVRDDTRLFEKLCLEGFQSGLSWLTILRKRDNFRRAFDGFDPRKVARYGDADIERLLGDAGIVRHRGKILATITNARRYLDLVDEAGSLAIYLWGFEPDPASHPASHPSSSGGVQFWGQSFICGTDGRVLAKAGAEEETVLAAELDLGEIVESRTGWPFLRDRRIDAYDAIRLRFIDRD